MSPEDTALDHAPVDEPLGRLLTAEEILAAPDLPERNVYVPEWGGAVRVRGFSKRAQQDMRRDATVRGELDNDRLEMLMFIHGIVAPRFSVDQYEQLRDKSAGAIDRVLQVILELSGMDRRAVERAEGAFRPTP